MTDWFTPSQRAAAERGAARARADCAAITTPTITDVTLDRGGFAERQHVAWCLLCQTPAARCTCPNAPETLIEDPIDAEADIASLIAESREQLRLHADAAASMVDVSIAGDRL